MNLGPGNFCQTRWETWLYSHLNHGMGNKSKTATNTSLGSFPPNHTISSHWNEAIHGTGPTPAPRCLLQWPTNQAWCSYGQRQVFGPLGSPWEGQRLLFNIGVRVGCIVWHVQGPRNPELFPDEHSTLPWWEIENEKEQNGREVTLHDD